MNPEALAKAKSRFEQSELALESLRNATKLSEFEPIWSNFLSTHNSVFTVLEQGAKQNARSRQWFGDKKKFRKKDPMLRYLHQARNADEHDIPSVVERKSAGGLTLPDKQPGGMIITKVTFKPAGANTETVLEDSNGLRNVTAIAPVFVLCRVHDRRFNLHYDPPTMHLGNPIDAPRALGVAELAVSYTRNLIMEAEAL